MILAGLFTSETDTIVPKWNWHKSSQARVFPSEISTNVPKWDWHDCSQLTQARLFPNDTGTIVRKWDSHNCSQVKLARLFPNDTGSTAPKWHWHDCSQEDFDFLICILFSSLFFGTILHKWVSLGNNCVVYQDYGTWSSAVLFRKSGPYITTKHNNKKFKILFWVILKKKSASSIHFKRNISEKWTHILPKQMVVMLRNCWYVCEARCFFSYFKLKIGWSRFQLQIYTWIWIWWFEYIIEAATGGVL